MNGYSQRENETIKYENESVLGRNVEFSQKENARSSEGEIKRLPLTLHK